MISTLNKLLIMIVPKLPIVLIKLFSNRYIAGISFEEALNVVEKINNNNMSATIDILGEHTSTYSEADKITNDYINLYKLINKCSLDCNISLKPSHIGSDLDIKYFEKNLIKIHNEASNNGNFLRIDMENSLLTQLTINSFNKLYKNNKNIGIVIQAYLHRSINDIDNLPPNTNIRLCKGIYNESSKVAMKNSAKINKNYIKLLEKSLERKIYVGIATHDNKLINKALDLIERKNINSNQFKFQILYGVPMGNILKQIINKNFKVRVYIPFGDNWYDYSIRRLKENPNIAGYIIKNFFKKNFY